MKISLKKRLISALVAGAMTISALPVAAIHAAAEGENEGKYVSEVFIAYGKTEDEATEWLENHGWEPVSGDFNAGKASKWDNGTATVMGIRRTNDPNDAITDMAVMNMSGGYSFDDYQGVLNEKKAEIDEFIDSFMPAIREFRANYNNEGSAAGKARADLAYELLNQYVDGSVDEEFALNDTGMPIGELLLKQTRRELGEENYDNLKKNERIQYGDLQQILLESPSPAVNSIETVVALAADSGRDTWLERLTDLSGLDLVGCAELVIPDAASRTKGNPAAARNLLMATYGDAASTLAAEYDSIQQSLILYESYMENNGLWQGDDESDDDYAARLESHIDSLSENEAEDLYNLQDFTNLMLLWDTVFNVEYAGEWGTTLGDFFYPMDETLGYQDNVSAFLPLAAALSDGQRAALEFTTLNRLIMTGSTDEAATKSVLNDTREKYGSLEKTSVYAGINRAIFRDGVALTNQAMMQKNLGRSPYAKMWDEDGIYDTHFKNLLISSLVIGTSAAVALVVLSKMYTSLCDKYAKIKGNNLIMYDVVENNFSAHDISSYFSQADRAVKNNIKIFGKVAGVVGCIALVLMVAAIAVKWKQLSKYYHRDFSRIPNYIVDEADIVTYLTDENGNPILDENGNQKKNIQFDQYVYYQVVSCNRQETRIGDWQDGVDDYEEWGCGDAADLNADIGKEWFALYTVKSSRKGDPILADSLEMQYGSDEYPGQTDHALHYFCYEYPADLADEAYAFNNKKDGIYLFWQTDTSAFTASTFSTGQLALAGFGCLAVGWIGATAVLMLRKKKQDAPEAPVAA